MSIVRIWPHVGIVLLLLAGVHGTDIDARERAVQRFLANKHDAMTAIAEEYGMGAMQCRPEAAGDLQALAAALLTVETLATPRLASWARATVVHIGELVGTVPDMSIGPGRIRLSSARAALQSSKSILMQNFTNLSDVALAEKLLEPCTSMQVIISIIDLMQSQENETRLIINRQFVRTASSHYNGQSDRTNLIEAKLSGEIYIQLVYNAYQHYRFARLAAR